MISGNTVLRIASLQYFDDGACDIQGVSKKR
jgi:hypothetical protein